MIVRPKSKGRPKVRKRQLVKGKPYVQPRSEFLGSVLTPENTREFKDKQFEFFVERFTADVVAGREKIQNQEDKTPEEIEIEVDEYNAKQPNEEQLMGMAERFARKMVTKENKHYAAYLKGKSFFEYNGQRYPVMTQLMVQQTQSIHDIIEQAKEYDRSKVDGILRESGEIEDTLEGIIHIPEGDNQTLRPPASDPEDPEDECDTGNEGGTNEMLSGDSNNIG